MAQSSSNAYLENWSLPGGQYPEMDHSFYTPNTFRAASPAILGASHFHTHPHCSTCLQGLDHASTTANLPTQLDSYGMPHDLAGPPVTSIFRYEVPASSLQTKLPPKKEISLPENNRTDYLEGGSPSHGGKKADDIVISFECGWKECKRPRPFKNKGTLMRHIKTQHVDMREIDCPVLGCDKVFNRKDRMDDHVYRVHRGLY